MSARVNWLGKLSDKLRRDLIPRFTRELIKAFPAAKTITVYDCFLGYSNEQEEKIVLGVEVRSAGAYHTHVVKLGKREAVENDYEGWRKCVLKHNFASRVFVSVTKKYLSRTRMAIIYQDAYSLFGTDPSMQSPQNLETVALWAAGDDKPDPISVERVIRQIYGDLARWFYRGSRPDTDKTILFYNRRLKRAVGRWNSDPRRIELRRDLIWLLCGHDDPTTKEDATYLDPLDYVLWALCRKRVPQTLVGRSHGDLHGRNILVGVQRGEAEFPAVFDYGEMDDKNVLAWDFVKLETELKARLLLPLYEDANVREVLLARCARDKQQNGVSLRKRPSADVSACLVRAERLSFSFEFESLLAKLTDGIGNLVDIESSEPPGGRSITGEKKLDRALAILLRIRQEAALWLGDRQPQRGQRGRWKDEYYFALAVYGLCTAKFDYKGFETEFALVSSGVAAAQISMAREEIRGQISGTPLVRAPHCGYPSYRVPLAHAHQLWKARRTKANIDRAMKLLCYAAKHCGHAVPLLQEYALVLAEAGRHDQALELLQPFQELCKVFCDEETLSRIGRLCKDLGDQALENDPVHITELGGHPAAQWYRTAYERYSEAFEIRKHYYPGINAATLALLQGQEKKSRQLARKVAERCRSVSLGALSLEDRFWVLVTEGEASLLLGNGEQASVFYSQALKTLRPKQAGMAQSAYNQVCRLWWALDGGKVKDVGPVVTVFRRSRFKLKRGPLGDCRR